MTETSSRTLDAGLLSETHGQTMELPLRYQTLIEQIQSPHGLTFTCPLLKVQMEKSAHIVIIFM